MTSPMTYFSSRPVPKQLYESASLIVHHCPYPDWASNLAWLRAKVASIGVFILPFELGGGIFDWNRIQYVRDPECDHVVIIRFHMIEYATGNADHRVLEVIMSLLQRNRAETTWLQPATRVLVNFGVPNPEHQLEDRGRGNGFEEEASEVGELVRNIVAPISHRFEVHEPTWHLVRERFSRSRSRNRHDEDEQWHQLDLGSTNLTCPSPSIAQQLLDLDPILNHPPYSITFTPHPESINVDSCCTLAIRLRADHSPLFLDTFCSLVAQVYTESSPGRHFFTPLRRSAADRDIGLVTASNMYLAYLIIHIPCYAGQRFRYLFSNHSEGSFTPNLRQAAFLQHFTVGINDMIRAQTSNDQLWLVQAKRMALEAIRKLATTAEFFKIGETKLTEATERLGRVQRDLDRMTDGGKEMSLKTVTSLCSRLQRSLVELRDVEVSLARVEKWYRQRPEDSDKKEREDADEASDREEGELDDAGGEDDGGIVYTGMLVQQPKRLGAMGERGGGVNDSMKIAVPAKRGRPDEEEEPVTPVRPYKQPYIAGTSFNSAGPTFDETPRALRGDHSDAIPIERRKVSLAEYTTLSRAKKERERTLPEKHE